MFEKELQIVCNGNPKLFILCGDAVGESFLRFDKNRRYKYLKIIHYFANRGSTKNKNFRRKWIHAQNCFLKTKVV